MVIELPVHCDRAAASALLPEFVDKAGDAPLQVDASKVKRLGLSMLNLLVSADRTAGGITLVDPSEPFRDGLSLAGLNSLLADGESA